VTRRSLGRGRLLVALGALIVLGGSAPAWWTIGGTVTPAYSGNAFEGIGILVFVAAVLLLALIVLPFTRREGESGLDRPAVYGLLAALGIGSFGLRVLQLADDGVLGLPDRAPGLWITAVGLAVIGWGLAELLNERPAEW
jgi:hypothetical protein